MSTWEEAFLAVSVALDVPLDAVVEALGDSGVVRASEVLRGLRAATKASRAYALATALAGVVKDLEEMKLR